MDEEREEEEIKVGARNSRRDASRLQQIHDYAVENGAVCVPTKNALKAVSETEDELRVKNYIVLFGGRDLEGIASPRKNPDGSMGEYFDQAVDLESTYTKTGRIYVDWEHGQDPDGIGNDADEVLGYVDWSTAKRDEKGIEAERVLNRRAKYMQWLETLIKEGLVGNSTEAIAGKTKKNADGGIVRWPLRRDTFTVTPMEPRMLTQNAVQAYKALHLENRLLPSEASGLDKDVEIAVTETAKENFKMEREELKALLEDNNKTIIGVIEEKAEAAATKAVENVLDKLPEVKARMNGEVQVTKAAEDQPFKSPGEFFKAVKNAAINPWQIDPRLKGLKATDDDAKATGMSEAQPSQAGFLVQQETAAGIIEKMYATGTALSVFTNRDPVTGNNMTYNMIDETSRADGSRWGGITGYWGAEAGTMTASKTTIRQLELKLKKVHALAVATDELLEDAPALGSWLTRTVPNELRFKVEDSIFNGDGVGKPLGLLASPASKLTVVRTDANEIDAFDIGRLWASRYAGANDYVWFGNQNIFPQLLNLTIGNMPVFLAAGGLSGLPYATLLGRPYYDVEYLPTLGTAGDLLLVSPSQYQMIEKSGGIQSASSIHVYFTTNEQAFRFTYRVDGAPLWRTTLTGKDAGTYSPFVGLAATT